MKRALLPLAALTVLPALLSRFGPRVLRRRHHKTRDGNASPSGFWATWSVLIERHPWHGAIAGLAIMLTLCAPVLALRLGSSDAGNNPPNQTTRQAYDLLAKGFGPGTNGSSQGSRTQATRRRSRAWPAHCAQQLRSPRYQPLASARKASRPCST